MNNHGGNTEVLPFEDRVIDTQYRDLLAKIMDDGEKITNPWHGEECRVLYGQQMRFDISNGMPVITERDMSGPLFGGALGEHIAFLNGARTHKELSLYGCKWWSRWVTKEKCAVFRLKEGDLGHGSYGVAWTKFPTPDGGTFNQIDGVIKQMRDFPFAFGHRITNWMPSEVLGWADRKRSTVVAPCHGDVSFFINVEKGELTLLHDQRSADVPVGLTFNMIQYTALGMMVAQVLGYNFTKLIYNIRNAHIYEQQYESVKELLSREPRFLPAMTLDPDVKDIFSFRPEHFGLEDYHPHSKMKIDTPI